MTVAEQLGTALKVVREAVGVSQGDLGAKIGKKQSYVHEWETGRKLLPLRLVGPIEDALGLSRGALLRQAGFVADAGASARDLLTSDPSLSPEDRVTLVQVYDRLRRDGGLEPN